VRGRKTAEGETYISANGYHYTKVEGKYRLTHHIVAEKILGRPIDAANERVVFKSKDKLNLSPDNIQVVPKGKGSLRRRKAQIEARIEELQAQLERIDEQLKEGDTRTLYEV
jgi:hypothetical protein